MSYRGFLSTDGDEERNDWSRLSQTLSSNVHKISQNVNQIQQLINQLETSEDSENLRTQLYEMQERSAQLTRETNACLKELAKLPQLVQSLVSSDQNNRNPLINSLNTYNNRKTNFVDNNNRKQFSVEKFMSPSSLVSKKSNFYEGKTVFGGANASRAARLAGTTPYNLLNRHHLAPVLRVNVETSKRLVESNEPLSSSSQRILEKLEKASTPLQDARRIPSSAPLKDYFQTSNLLNRSSKRPKLGANPVFSQTHSEPTPFQPKRWELKLSNKNDHKVSATETTDQLINSCDNKYLMDSNQIKSNETFGGKMMRKDNKREERRTKPQITANGGSDNSLDLLKSAKPLSSFLPSNQPKIPEFSFGSKPSAKSSLTDIVVSEDSDFEFKFSEPKLKTREQKSDAILPTGKNGRKPFVFSSPLSAITQKPSNDSQKFENESNILKQSLRKSENQTTVDSISKESTHSLPNQIEKKTENKKNETSVNKWICVCLFQNISSDNKCKACNKERNSQIKSSVTSVPSQKTTVESNITTSTPIPSVPITQNASIGWGNKFQPPSGSWSCSVCMVNNPGDKTKCLACEEPKPGAKADVSTKESLKSSCELWQCFYCKHSNEMSKNICTSCAKVKTPVATKEDLDKLYGGQTFKFGINEQKKDTKKDVNQIKKQEEGKTDIFKQSFNNFLNSNESTPQTTSQTTSNEFVFGSTSSEDKNKLSSDSIVSKPSDTNSGTLFKFGVPPSTSKPTSEVNPTEKPNTNMSDIFGFNKSSNNSFNFGIPTTASTTTPDITPKPSLESTTPQTITSHSTPFVFDAQNKDNDLLKTKKNVSFDLEDKSKSISETIPNKSTDSTPLGFQIPKPSEDKQQTFKGFNSSPSGSIFGSTTTSISTGVTTVSTVSITSFLDSKFTSKPSESQNKTTASLFGGPATTTSFTSPFSLTNSFGSGQKTTPLSGKSIVSEANDTKSLFSLTPSSTIKSFDSMISSQTNSLVSTSSATPTAPLSLSNSSSTTKGLVFGNSNTNLQSFSSQSSAATTKPNFSFNINSNTSPTTTATTTDSGFGSNANTLFGSNPNKGFTFGNSALNSSQTPAFSFTIPSSNSLSNTSSNLNFGLNANNTTSAGSADTTPKPSTNSLFTFGAQNSEQFSNPLTQKSLNNTNNNSKTSSQFSFGLSSNASTGQSNSTNLFANAINPAQNSLSFNQMAPTVAPVANPSPFTFGGGFGSTQSTPAIPQMQSRTGQQPQQPPLPPPAFNFSAQPTFDFGSLPNTGASPAGPVFQFSAEQTSQTVATNRNIKKAKRRLNPT